MIRSTRSWRDVRAPRLLLGSVVVALTLCVSVACTDEQSSSYTATEVGKLEVDRPAAWGVEFAVEAPWTQGWRATPTSVEQIQLSGDFGEYVSASQGMSTLIAQAQVRLPGFTVVQGRDIDVKGATSGRATRYTITDNAGSQIFGEWIVAAHWPYPQSVAVSVLSPTFDPGLERRLIDSMRLKPVLS